MKVIFIIIALVCSVSAFADEYFKGSVQYLDGKSKAGLVETTMTEVILFKASENAAVEKIQSSLLRSVTYFGKDGSDQIYYYVKIYLGWGQTRLSSEPEWLRVVQKGIATLLIKVSSMRGSIYNTTSAKFSDYFAFREGEEGAKMIANISTLNNNQTFRAKAPLYFADYPELAGKIKSKEYTWKDLELVFREYNTWAANKKK